MQTNLKFRIEYDCRDSQLSRSAIRFRDFFPSHWLQLILSVANLVQKFFPVFPQPRQGISSEYFILASS